MHLLLAMLFFIIMIVTDGILDSMKYKSDHRLPKDQMEVALGWAEAHGDNWMIRYPKLCPEEVRKESYYRSMLRKYPDKDREWVDKTWPWKNDRFVQPNKEVWDNYWTEKSGMVNYETKYPWLKWPSNADEWGYEIPEKPSFKY